MKLNSIDSPFKDGLVKIYEVANIAAPGAMPKEGITLKYSLRYDERTVGMGRYWSALQAQAKVEQMIRVLRIDAVSTQNIAIPNDGEQYKIIQIQYPTEIEPPCMDLSLERLEANYDIK